MTSPRIDEAALAVYERHADGSAENEHHEDCEAAETGDAEDCECSVVPMADAIHTLVAAVRERDAEIARLSATIESVKDKWNGCRACKCAACVEWATALEGTKL